MPGNEGSLCFPSGQALGIATARGKSAIPSLSGEHRWPSLAGRHSLKLVCVRHSSVLVSRGPDSSKGRKDRWCSMYRRVSHESFGPDRRDAAGIFQTASFGVALNFLLLGLREIDKTQCKKQDDVYCQISARVGTREGQGIDMQARVKHLM